MKKTCKRLVLASIALVAMMLLLPAGYLLLYGNKLAQSCPRELTQDCFDFVHLGMNINEVNKRVGPPQSRGNYMHQYKLADDNMIILRIDGTEYIRGIWILRKDGVRVDFFTGKAWPELGLDDFNFLWLYMPYDEVIERVGEPHIESGSGIHSVVYKLVDGQAIVLDIGPRQPMTDTTLIVGDARISSGNHVVNFFDHK